MVCIDWFCFTQKIKETIIYHVNQPVLITLRELIAPSESKQNLLQIVQYNFRL